MNYVPWMVKSGKVNCTECRELYSVDGLEPPCGTEECDKPSDLMPENQMAWMLWILLSNYGRGCGDGVYPIQIHNVISTCDVYDSTEDDFEKVLYIEELAYPVIVDDYNNRLNTKMKAGKEE